MSNPPLPSLVLDASVMINFLAVDRMDLILNQWTAIHIAEEVQDEITES